MASTEQQDPVSGFAARHIGPRSEDLKAMLSFLGFETLDDLTRAALPEQIQLKGDFCPAPFGEGLDEAGALTKLSKLAEQNQLWRSYIGSGYYGTIMPAVIRRAVLENPGWYTQYTPYQPEISQGRLEALLNFQTLVCSLTGFPVANASLLDEASAAAEALALSLAYAQKSGRVAKVYFVSEGCYPQTVAVLQTRARALGVEVKVGSHSDYVCEQGLFGALLQYPDRLGRVCDYAGFAQVAHDVGALVAVAADPLALTLLKPPAEFGADLALGSMQRFGVSPSFGGPHAAYLAVRDDLKRIMPGRLVGVSKDSAGQPALRLSLQTREQHIRREKATSNICTAQVLPAVLASMYAVYHGPDGLQVISRRVGGYAAAFAEELKRLGYKLLNTEFFDTLAVELSEAELKQVLSRAKDKCINLGCADARVLIVAFDESMTESDLRDLIEVFGGKAGVPAPAPLAVPKSLLRTSPFCRQEVFLRYHSETELLRYIKRLEAKDLSLCTAMIPLGSCTMKLNPSASMLPITWDRFAAMHPFAPREQAQGYMELFRDLEQALCSITGFSVCSLQPNSGAQGEYAGLLTIAAYHRSRGEARRKVCLIPRSAHGTNPASAVMAGFEVVAVECDEAGNIDLQDLKKKAEDRREDLGVLMVTYPSTHGVFEEGIKEVCQTIHALGGQVYMDGANLNALVGLSRPAELGADVLHINLHKTFAMPHGGGGPGVGPIVAGAHLAPFLPSHVVVDLGERGERQQVAAAPWGNAGILPIAWMYLALMGAKGLRRASQVAILNANYIAKRLSADYTLLYKGSSGLVAHECILDLRDLKQSAGVEVDDVAKRLIDYGFHPPTVSWPVPGTIMVEPTESESKEELDRFCEAMICIREEARRIESGELPRDNNPLKRAPHTIHDITMAEWDRPYTRKEAVFPSESTRAAKFWPSVGRVDNAYGDRNLVCCIR
ncbi:MAG: aminomethyl-transferring glycine dehydrogenase [Deltaproteobacteria bacterium]|nr:aminomethyl-transferring glycine dehydrogenase [Deltaproteobacteria bacterium]